MWAGARHLEILAGIVISFELHQNLSFLRAGAGAVMMGLTRDDDLSEEMHIIEKWHFGGALTTGALTTGFDLCA